MTGLTRFYTSLRCDRCAFFALVTKTRMDGRFTASIIDTGDGEALHANGGAHVGYVRAESSYGQEIEPCARKGRRVTSSVGVHPESS